MVAPTSSSRIPRIAVVTVSYGSADVLSHFLDSLADASSESIDIVIADNKPDGSEQVPDLALASNATYLPMGSNKGYGYAINAAVQSITHPIDWILVSNPDLIMGPRSIDALVAVGDEDSTIGSVGPATFTNAGDLYPSARAVPSLRNGVGHALYANLWIGNPWSRAYRNDSGNSMQRRDAGWLSGACVLVRKSAFDELNGFDPGFFMYFEDVDLGYRLGKLGYRNVYEPAATVTHTGAHSTNSDSNLMIAAHHDSARRFLNKKYSGTLLWPLRVVLALGLNLRSMLTRRKSRHQ